MYCYSIVTILLLSYYLTAGTITAQEWFMAIGADAVCSESHLSSLGVGSRGLGFRVLGFACQTPGRI